MNSDKKEIEKKDKKSTKLKKLGKSYLVLDRGGPHRGEVVNCETERDETMTGVRLDL